MNYRQPKVKINFIGRNFSPQSLKHFLLYVKCTSWTHYCKNVLYVWKKHFFSYKLIKNLFTVVLMLCKYYSNPDQIAKKSPDLDQSPEILTKVGAGGNGDRLGWSTKICLA